MKRGLIDAVKPADWPLAFIALDLDLPRSNDASLCECLNSKLGGFAVTLHRYRRIERRLQNRSWITLRVEKLLTGRTAVDDEVTLLVNAKNDGVALAQSAALETGRAETPQGHTDQAIDRLARQTCCVRR